MAHLYLMASDAAKARGKGGGGREWRASDEEDKTQSPDKRRWTEKSGD